MARTKQMLTEGFDAMMSVYRYLYLDENNKITFLNTIDVPLELSMTDDGHVLCRNMNYPEYPPTDYTEHMTVSFMLDLKEQLMEIPAVEFPKSFQSRWEEIHALQAADTAQNRLPMCLQS